MGIPKPHLPVKLFYAILFVEAKDLSEIKGLLTKRHGPIDAQSEIFDFNYTGYYNKEMNADIKRIIYSFEKLIDARKLCGIKLESNSMEAGFPSPTGGRRINLDPGYLTPAKVILASAKDNIQRIYIDNGIYEEITLFYKNRTFNAFEWTFPDYKESYIPFFNQLRNKFMLQTKESAGAPPESEME
jgi:hypothetical protein